jgi:DNA replication protein DnaC
MCPICDDTGWKPVDENGVRHVVRCDCWRETVGRQRLADARIPRRYQHCAIDAFQVYNDSLRRAVQYARRLAEDFPAVDKGLLLLGLPGVGKTHIAVAILKEVIRRSGAHGLFYTTSELLALIRGTYDSSVDATESQILRPVLRSEILVLDDLGRERMSQWVDEMLHIIVNTRYSEQRLTLFTSNHDVGADPSDPESLQCRVGMRVYSRLYEMCEFIHIDGADYRERPVNASPDDLLAMWKLRSKTLPARTGRPARAQLREPQRDGKADLKWPGGRAGS